MKPSQSELGVRVHRYGEHSVRVKVEGELDLLTSPELEAALHDEITAGQHVVLDLSSVSFIDSSGVNAVVRALRMFGASGASLAVRPELSLQVRQVLEITGVDRMIPFATE